MSKLPDSARIGRKSMSSHGYVKVYVGPAHHLADSNGYAYEHRLVAEKKLGRRLKPDEIVHHKNHDKTLNTDENLEVAPSRWHHNALHRTSSVKRQEPGQSNERVPCACGCGELIWRFDSQHIEVRFISGHNGKLNKKFRPPKPRQGEHNRRKTHCPAGHEYTTENTSITNGHRRCRTCHRQRAAEQRRMHHGE